MVEKNSKPNSEFFITVKYNRRNYCYKVRHQLVDNKEEIFNIITRQKIVVLKSKRPQLSDKALLDNKQVYTYNKHEITNKCLMKRIIEVIDKQIQFNNQSVIYQR